MKLVVSVDTEADNQWNPGIPITTQNINYWAPFQKLCKERQIKPTYLISSEIAASSNAVNFLRPLVKDGTAEVGAHLHPWTTPPFVDQPGLTCNDFIHAYPSELPEYLLRQKLINLTDEITLAVGKKPVSFRSGRFGFDQACANVLSDLGYRVDSSITPLISWKNVPGLSKDGGPDFSNAPVIPYHLKTDNHKQLLEIPVTIIMTKRILVQYPSLLPFYKLLYRMQNNRLLHLNWLPPQPVWFRPYPEITIEHLRSAWNCALEMNLSVVVMVFHSSELMPGGSPYRPDQKSVAELLQLLRNFFDYVDNNSGESITLEEASYLL